MGGDQNENIHFMLLKITDFVKTIKYSTYHVPKSIYKYLEYLLLYKLFIKKFLHAPPQARIKIQNGSRDSKLQSLHMYTKFHCTFHNILELRYK